MARLCSRCGTKNRTEALFCFRCGEKFVHPRSSPASFQPSDDDHRWLESSLTSAEEQDVLPREADISTAPLVLEAAGIPVKEKTMEQDSPPKEPLFAGRYELRSITGEDLDSSLPQHVNALDNQPWQRCWSCGSTANEEPEPDAKALYCNDCGASLIGKEYHGWLSNSNEPVGSALINTVYSDSARAILPEVWDQVSDGERTLVLLRDEGRPSLSLPLDEMSALRVGIGLATLLSELHKEGLLLGSVSPSDLEIGPDGAPHLRDVPEMARLDEAEGPARDKALREDLRKLAVLLEACTETPRTTQRLQEDEADAVIEAGDQEPLFSTILREVRTGKIDDPQSLAQTLQNLLDDRTKPVPLRAVIGAATHTGMIRDHNEDSYLAFEIGMNNSSTDRTWGLYIVADGMGGHAAGEVASGLAIRGAANVVLDEYIAPTLDANSEFDEEAAKEIVRRAILRANEYVIKEGQARGNDMGTTITMALVIGNRAIIGNIGDSRTYIYKGNELRRISKDHSLVMRLVELGQISEDDIYTHPQRNAVLRSLGDKANIEIDIFSERLEANDVLFLCSDGQWEMTRNHEMAAILQSAASPQAACDELIRAANAAGGEDNITSIVVKFEAMT